MKRLRRFLNWGFLALACLGALLFSGCTTTDDTENASARPWNAPKGWETGLPSSITEGH
jgi:hypothetical protein